MYLNTEANKKLPFPTQFECYNATDPLYLRDAIIAAEDMPHIHTIVVDSLTFMMDRFESLYISGATDTMKGWADYNQFFKQLMQETVASSTKNVYFLAHTLAILNENEAVMEVKVPIKGALKNNGIEAYFSTVVSTKKVTIKELEKYSSPLLNITEEERELGYKHCYQTRLTKKTVNDRIRAPMGMWSISETYIDNNVEFLTQRLHEYYAVI